ncbi:MAG: methyl-accepting chemotaxis protein [Gammaproteobacteria bacterium]|nr:methyl-accepting chemotaxis protein [Gammaproteobacteria bacterium]
MASSGVNLIARIGRKPILTFLVVLLFFSVFGFAANSYLVTQNSQQDENFLTYASRLSVLSQQIAKNVDRAIQGSESIYSALQEEINEFESSLGYLKAGNPAQSLPPSANDSVDDLNQVNLSWESMKTKVDYVLANQKSISSIREVSSDLTISMLAIQQENAKVVAALVRSNAAANQIALAQRQALITERMMRSVDKLLEIGNTEVLIDNISRDKQAFQKVLKGLISGDRELLLVAVKDRQVKTSLARIDELFSTLSTRLNQIITLSAQMIRIDEAENDIYQTSGVLLGQTEELIDNYRRLVDTRVVTPTTGLTLGLLVFFIILAISIMLYRESNAGLAETAEQNKKNQAAILQLLDELAALADGDLTVQATVTESFTGAIADSINFSIDQTREVVSQINATATRVSDAATGTQESVVELEKAAKKQSQEIIDVSSAVDEMVVSIDRVSSNAAESTSVAERSVEIANNGTAVVQNTIGGMEKIRGQIQETAKRIKRLGESSQEIGDIVNLINDIADQTNILSLNASIQASMAGEAGRGFAVVADEVQRLAERSGAAAKQIAALVKTIQTDTNEAVISMENTTSEVVQGARLAQDAGVALDEIEGVSKSLAEIIENISEAARQQAASAGKISSTMKSIQETASQTTESTRSIVAAVGNFASMTDELRASVSGFKLPG